MQPNPELIRTVEKNLADLSNCILKRRAYNAFMGLHSAHSLDYFRVAAHALHNDLYADAHRVFDKHKDAASFWNIKDDALAAFEKALADSGADLDEMERTARKLRQIRDRIQFHTDRRNVIEPSSAWDEAALTGDEFIKLTESAHEVLRIMYREMTGIDKPVPPYHGEDIGDIMRAYKAAHPKAPLIIDGA